MRDEASSESIPTNARWMAPELFDTKNEILSVDGGKAADVYSFAMVMFEVRLLTLTAHVCILASTL